MIELITKSVGSIVNSIQQSAVLAVRSLKAHVFTTKVSNLPEVQKVSGEVKVNQSGTESGLSAVKISVGRVENAVREIKIPTKVEITNLPKPTQFPAFPRELAISNLPKQREFPKEFSVTNQPTKELSDINDSVGRLSGDIKKLKLDPTINVATPAPVVVPAPRVTVTQQEIDYDKLAKSVLAGQTKIDYDKLATAIGKEVSGMIVSTGGGNSSTNAYSDGRPGKALIDGDRHVQVDVVTMPEIVIPAVTGGATEAKQDTLVSKIDTLIAELETKPSVGDIEMSEMIPMLRSILMAIANPSYVDKSANQMRAQITGSLTTLTTCTTVTNLTNIGSFQSDHLQRMNNMTAWATNIRSLIT